MENKLHGAHFKKIIKIHILKLQTILKEITHFHSNAYYMCVKFEDAIHYDESYSKKDKK